MSRFGIRTRLTALVTAVFGAVVVVGAIAIVRYVEQRLIDNALDNAEALLSEYLSEAEDGGSLVATVEPGDPGAFFYLDENGNQISQDQYIEELAAVAPTGAGGDVGSSLFFFDESSGAGGSGDTQVGPSADPGDEHSMSISIFAEPVGQLQEVQLSPETVAVARRVRFDDGTEMSIGVSASLQPVEQSMTAIRTILWIALPVLAAGVGLLTYITVGRVLRPVHSITRQTRDISSSNLSERVPVPDTRDDIAELAITMNDMLGRLDEGQQRQRQFVSDASHELRSPIAASQSQLEVALTHPAAADWPETAEAVLGEQVQLGDLVDDLLALTSIDEQNRGSVSQIDLGELIREETARPHHTRVQTQVQNDVRITGNRARLARAVRNVVDNADQHAESAVRVTLNRDEDDVIVHVDDDGPGVPAAQRARIFDRFARLDEPRNRNEGGAGLGLAIVRQVVQSHGGTVECTESPLGGARISMTFPPSC